MKYLQTNHERNSATITTLIVAILILLCFVVGQDYKVQPEEYGVAINFGNAAAGGENIDIPSEAPQETPTEEIIEEEVVEEEAIEEEVVEEEIVEEVEEVEEEAVEEVVKEIEAAEKQALEEEKILKEEAEIAEKLKKEEEAKEKAEAEAKEKEAKEKAEKEAKEAEAKAKGKAAAKARAAERAKKAKAAADAKAAAEAKAIADGKAKAAAAAAQKKKEGNGEVSFALIENVPVYPGCEGGDNNAKKKCMNAKIKKFLGDNFSKSLASDLGLSGIQKMGVSFKINQSGHVVGIRIKAPHPELTEEAKRVTNLLPKMKPGMQQGKPVTVKYFLPLNVKAD